MPKVMLLLVVLNTLKSNHMLSFTAPLVFSMWKSSVCMPPAPEVVGVLVAAGGAFVGGGTLVGGTDVAGGGAAAWMTGRSLTLPLTVATSTDTQPWPCGAASKVMANHCDEL